MNDISSSVTPEHSRALVLGGGGSTGNAWLIGVIAGLFEAGLDVTAADLIVGTSAGATAAAQISAGLPPLRLLAQIVDAGAPAASDRPVPGGSGSGGRRGPSGAVSDHLARTAAIIAAADGPGDMRRRLGAAALEAEAALSAEAAEPRPSFSARWRDVVASRLPGPDWPAQRVLVTAIDARTGEPVVFDRHAGVDLVDAVAASTSSGVGVPPYAVGERRYLDGGYRRNENADLAAGCARVLVLSPFGGRTRYPVEWRMQLAAQVEELRAGGSRVETLFPDGGSGHLFGVNAMDPALRPPAARAGYEQGRVLAGRLGEFW